MGPLATVESSVGTLRDKSLLNVMLVNLHIAQALFEQEPSLNCWQLFYILMIS